MSFPKKGYTLSLDFKNTAKVHALLNELDLIVNFFGGRVYLSKDARIKKTVFEKSYPNIETFRSFRKTHALENLFESEQSRRLKL